jgi:hypothetical protein
MAIKKFEKEEQEQAKIKEIKIPSKEEVLKMVEETFNKEELFYLVKFKELYPKGGLINAKRALETAKSSVLKKIQVIE